MLAERGAPDPFLDTFTGLVAARAVTTAVMLGVFDALHEAPAAPDELAQRVGLDPLGAETLLATLAALGGRSSTVARRPGWRRHIAIEKPPCPPATSTSRSGSSTPTSAAFASSSGRDISNRPRM